MRLIRKHMLVTILAFLMLLPAAIYFMPNTTSVAEEMTVPKIEERAVTVIVDGENIEVKTQGQTVQEVLTLAGVTLGAEDRTEPELSVANPELIRVIRVEKKKITEQNNIAYAIEKVTAENVYAGVERVRQKGKKGLEELIYEIVLENGVETSKKLIEKVLVRQPVKQIVDVGTLQMVSRDGKSIEFSKSITMSATGYTHTGNMTRTDIWPSVGIVAVDPKVIPLRTRLFIEGYGYATAMDTGGAIKGNRIDLFFETRAEALKWGRRSVQVFILE